MTIFFLLNGLGLVFLLYVLANFWKEGHRLNVDCKNYGSGVDRRDWEDVFVATHPISHSAQGGVSVIPFRIPGQEHGRPDHAAASFVASGEPAKRISTR